MNAIVKRLTACLLLLTLCLAALPGLGESAPAYDFKKFRWGDSQESVMAVEGTPTTSPKRTPLDPNYIATAPTAAGRDVLLAYYFRDGGLYSVRYILTEEHSVDSLYIDDYNTFKQALTKKYGDPLLDNEKWTSDSKKSFYADDKGRALNYGYLSYYTCYITERVIVEMDMSADNYEVSTIINYSSLTVSPGKADFSEDS